MSDKLKEYEKKFGDFPPLFMMMTYDHPVYVKLIDFALDIGEPITADMIEKEMERQDVKCDM